ncbi:uncharacterized protein LOC123713814 [Pieris brassicae]|uniref:uncharacterized protein LOC123713814 n=1 Tax=Pieris brassicae TaxID=7116 RepID=UPI001E660320|nr:uncharacterized protein LOC123713814 [Pieris brassicae]
MLRHEFEPTKKLVSLLPSDKRSCLWISDVIILQCILVFIGASTINYCVWSPEHAKYDYDKLARVMYLYDPHACGYNLRTSKSILSLELSNDTHGLNIRPIKHMPAIVTVTSMVPAKTRRYVKISIIIHSFWLVIAICLRIFRFATKVHILKIILSLSYFSCISIIFFDVSMAIVYIAHIQRSLTTGMILRYSGWSVEMKLDHYNRFGGWLPMAASVCWLRGIIIFGVNIYICRKISLIKKSIKKREVNKKLMLEENMPIPEPVFEDPLDDDVLYYRNGEFRPVEKKNQWSFFF